MIPLTLDAMTLDDVQTARVWRNAVRDTLRTPHLISDGQQEAFCRDVICNRASPHRYWSVRQGGEFVAMAGITDIEWENGHGEISLIVDPERRGGGIGQDAVALVLAEAFGALRLATVYAECYTNNPAVSFWGRMADRYEAGVGALRRRKFASGKLHDSLFITFTAEQWAKRAA